MFSKIILDAVPKDIEKPPSLTNYVLIPGKGWQHESELSSTLILPNPSNCDKEKC